MAERRIRSGISDSGRQNIGVSDLAKRRIRTGISHNGRQNLDVNYQWPTKHSYE